MVVERAILRRAILCCRLRNFRCVRLRRRAAEGGGGESHVSRVLQVHLLGLVEELLEVGDVRHGGRLGLGSRAAALGREKAANDRRGRGGRTTQQQGRDAARSHGAKSRRRGSPRSLRKPVAMSIIPTVPPLSGSKISERRFLIKLSWVLQPDPGTLSASRKLKIVHNCIPWGRHFTVPVIGMAFPERQ